MNYFSDQRGIFERYLNESAGWAAHLQHTKQAILTAANQYPKNSCAILGSGWLLDIPLDELAQQFNEVYLFDILHPSQIKHKLQQYPNVHAIEQDITGGAVQQIYEAVQMFKSYKQKKNLSELQITGFQYPHNFDFVASVNILSQLDQMLLSYLRKYGLYNESELKTLKTMLQTQHVNSLPQNKTCLITDYEEIITNIEGEVEIRQPILNVDLSAYHQLMEWEWQFDQQQYYPGKNVIFRVKAVVL
ncbi:MAG: hypothetical protein ACP5PS_05985 [Bacteroidales bacterium]